MNFISVIETHKAPETKTEWAICFDAHKKEGLFEDFTIEQFKAIDRGLGSKTKITITKHSPFAIFYNLKNYIQQSTNSVKTKLSSVKLDITRRTSENLEKLVNINRKKVTLTKKEIEQFEHISFKGTYEISVFSFLFKKDVQLYICTDNGEQEITDEILKSINCFLQFDNSHLPKIKAELWSHYNACMENIGYGCVSDELLEKLGNTEANKEYFGCFDENCTYKLSQVAQVYFDTSFDEAESTFCSVSFDIPWEDEHGFSVHFKDGEIDSFT